MKVLREERSMEPCIEGGFFGYYFYLDGPVDEAFIQGLEHLGSLSYLPALKKPFFLVRGARFAIRGQVGDEFCKVGVEANDRQLLERLRGELEQAGPFGEE